MRIESRAFTFMLGAIAALTSLSIDMSLPTIPAIEGELERGAGQGSLTISLFLAGYALTPLLGGPLADRLGRRPVLLGSLGLFTVSAIVCSLSVDFPMLLGCRLLQGCASGIATTLPLAIVRDLLDGNAARQRMSEVTVMNNIMPLIAPIIGSSIMLLGSWRMIFGVQGVFAALIGFSLAVDFEETLPQHRRSLLTPSALLGNYQRLLRSRTFVGLALINGLTFACMFSFISVSPLLLIQRMHVSHSHYATMFAAIAIGTVLGAVTSALLNKRPVAAHGIISWGLALMATSSLSLCVLESTGHRRALTILPLVFTTLFGFGLLSPSITVEALAQMPNLAGAGSGGLRCILMLFGSGTSAYLATFCARHLSYSEIATTLTMSIEVLLAWAIYSFWVHGGSGAANPLSGLAD